MNDAAVTEAERSEVDELDRQRDVLVTEFNARVAPLNTRAAELFANIRRRLAKGETPVFEPPVPEPEDAEHDDPVMTAAATALINWKAIAGSVSASSRAKHRRENAHELLCERLDEPRGTICAN